MPTFISPDGNFEIWDVKPDGYCTEDEWRAKQPAAPTPPLAEVQTAKRALINAGFDAAMTASLTMPSSSTPALAFEVAYAIYDWRTEDPDGYAVLLAIHTARRDALLATVDAATTVEAVQEISIAYAV